MRYYGEAIISNVIIPGECIKTEKDAEKCLKDADADFLDEGWLEHEQIMEDKKRKNHEELYYRLKGRVANRQFAMPYSEGQFEQIFGKKIAGERGET